ITRRHHGFVLAHVEGPDTPMHNGARIGQAPVPLHTGDMLELAGTEMQFIQS
ncbi:MAG TPA: FHA domain-containing protein, partial [Comamonadaceae bacterium]|nr:FHA domain-containing protein [Comamonadaceae bacterium]